MGEIYAGSFCTLAASSSTSPFRGCRVNAEKNTYVRTPRHIDLEFGPRIIRILEESPIE